MPMIKLLEVACVALAIALIASLALLVMTVNNNHNQKIDSLSKVEATVYYE